ncbi:MAG: PilZ domain-containing protein [bacterium]|nr:PilZ domain-containing protein [Gammaproteobacteria bacterium]HIL96843.1 PilZ domain-containing protein [Pseudomonadales bacterium]
MREFVRHPSDIPIQINAGGSEKLHLTSLQNLSHGGLCCEVEYSIEVGMPITINIPLVKPPYVGQGIVVWCRAAANGYEIGIRFSEPQEAFKSRMVEQVCQIEHYKRQVYREDGRDIDGEQAAREWIEKYAADFSEGFGNI